MSSIAAVNPGLVNLTQTRTPEVAEVKGARDRDGDADDGGAKALPPAPSPTVNAAGEKLGQVISTSA